MTTPIPILLYEDNNELREALKASLDYEKDILCCGAHPNAMEILKHVEEFGPSVILMDIDMPGINGIEAVKLVKSKFPEVEILMLTVFEDNENVFKSISAGATGYLLKNSSVDKIVMSIKDVTTGGAPMSASIARKIILSFPETKNNSKSAFQLSDREEKILSLLVKGKSYKMIGEELFISIDTVRTYIKRIYNKLHVHSAPEAVAIAIQQKLIS